MNLRPVHPSPRPLNLTVKETLTELGGQLRARRIDADLTQAEVAERASLSRQAVHNLENGKGASLTTLVGVLRATGDQAWLLSFNPESDEPTPMQMLKLQQEREKARRKRVRRPSAG